MNNPKSIPSPPQSMKNCLAQNWFLVSKGLETAEFYEVYLECEEIDLSNIMKVEVGRGMTLVFSSV